MPTVAALRIHFSHAQYVVLACVLLQALRIIITNQTHKLSRGHEAWTQPHLLNLTDTFQLSSASLANASYTGTWNITHLVPAVAAANSSAKEPESITPPSATFFSASTARTLLYAAVASAVGYYWNLWLERRLPARPRGDLSSVNHDKLADGDEQLEEKIVEKWIASGKIKRASLSFWNTLAKWLLDISVGRALVLLATELTRIATYSKQPAKALQHLPSVSCIPPDSFEIASKMLIYESGTTIWHSGLFVHSLYNLLGRRHDYNTCQPARRLCQRALLGLLCVFSNFYPRHCPQIDHE